MCVYHFVLVSNLSNVCSIVQDSFRFRQYCVLHVDQSFCACVEPIKCVQFSSGQFQNLDHSSVFYMQPIIFSTQLLYNSSYPQNLPLKNITTYLRNSKIFHPVLNALTTMMSEYPPIKDSKFETKYLLNIKFLQNVLALVISKVSGVGDYSSSGVNL